LIDFGHTLGSKDGFWHATGLLFQEFFLAQPVRFGRFEH